MLSSLLDTFREMMMPRHLLQDVTRSPEEVLQSLGYDPEILRQRGFKTKGIRVLETKPSLTEKQKMTILDSVFPNPGFCRSRDVLLDGSQVRRGFWMAMHSRYNASAWINKGLVLLSAAPDRTYRGMVSTYTGIPEDELEIDEKEAETCRIQAFTLLHELAHFEKEGDSVNYKSRPVLLTEIYCDSRALDGLAIQKDFNSDHFCRDWILMRGVQDINNSIYIAINNYIKRGALPPSEGIGYRPDFSHSTALFLKNRNRRISCEEVTQEYNSLLFSLYSTIRCEWRLSLDDRISKTYKAACLLLEDRGTNSFVLSSLQREALELYVEGTEHFCPMKCLCWRIELENEMIPVLEQVYDWAPEAGL